MIRPPEERAADIDARDLVDSLRTGKITGSFLKLSRRI
jgi:hypothetical protein